MLTVEYANAIEAQIKSLADLFKDRLDLMIIEDVKQEVDYREWGLAFEVLCESLFEFKTPISEEEWYRITNVAEKIKYDCSYLRCLISF